MPWWMITYVVVFGLLVFINLCYLVTLKCKILVILYELFAGIFLLGMIFAYWQEQLQQHLSFLIVPVFILILITDMRMTIFRDFDELGVELPEEMSEEEMEIAGALSLIFAAPAYIFGGLVCLRFIV